MVRPGRGDAGRSASATTCPRSTSTQRQASDPTAGWRRRRRTPSAEPGQRRLQLPLAGDRRDRADRCAVVERPWSAARLTAGEAWRGRARHGCWPLLGLSLLAGLMLDPGSSALPVGARRAGDRAPRRQRTSLAILASASSAGSSGGRLRLRSTSASALLARPNLVIERAACSASMRRAGALSRGQFWRLLGISLLVGARRRHRRPASCGSRSRSSASRSCSCCRRRLGHRRSTCCCTCRRHGHHRRGDQPVHRRRDGAAVLRPALPQGGLRHRAPQPAAPGSCPADARARARRPGPRPGDGRAAWLRDGAAPDASTTPLWRAALALAAGPVRPGARRGVGAVRVHPGRGAAVCVAAARRPWLALVLSRLRANPGAAASGTARCSPTTGCPPPTTARRAEASLARAALGRPSSRASGRSPPACSSVAGSSRSPVRPRTRSRRGGRVVPRRGRDRLGRSARPASTRPCTATGRPVPRRSSRSSGCVGGLDDALAGRRGDGRAACAPPRRTGP